MDKEIRAQKGLLSQLAKVTHSVNETQKENTRKAHAPCPVLFCVSSLHLQKPDIAHTRQLTQHTYTQTPFLSLSTQWACIGLTFVSTQLSGLITLLCRKLEVFQLLLLCQCIAQILTHEGSYLKSCNMSKAIHLPFSKLLMFPTGSFYFYCSTKVDCTPWLSIGENSFCTYCHMAINLK